VTVDDVSRTDQISTDFEALMDARSRQPDDAKRRSIKLFGLSGTLPPNDRILDFVNGYYDG
jgi:hypothetical protein